MMFLEILEMVRNWHVFAQFLFVMGIATLGTFIALAITGLIGDFINHTLPVLFRGYPSQNRSEDDVNS